VNQGQQRKCGFSGCKRPAVWSCRQLWGKGGTLLTCDEHKPDRANRPESLNRLPFFYDVQPIDPPVGHLGLKYPTGTDEAAMGGGPW
jgi:hypothetical protein